MEAQLEVVTPEVQENTQRDLIIINQANNTLMISTVDDYRVAQGLMKTVKERIKKLNDERMDKTRLLDRAKIKIMADYAPSLEKLEMAKNYLNTIMVKFTEEEETRRREEERRLQEDARKRAEEEVLRQALEAEAAGEKEEADQIMAELVYVPAIKVMSEIPKSKGSYIREDWHAEIFDLAILIKAIANNKVSLEAAPGVIYSEADDLKKWAGKYMTFLNGQAGSYKQSLNIPGVRAVSRKTQV